MSEKTFQSKARLSIIAILALLVFILVVQNQETVSTQVYFWTVEMPRFVLLGTFFFVGGFAGYMVGRGTRLGKKKKEA